MNRQEIYQAIDDERDHQDKKWGGPVHDQQEKVACWITYMQYHLNQAAAAISTQQNNIEALSSLRKVAALAIACFEVHGVTTRFEEDNANYISGL